MKKFESETPFTTGDVKWVRQKLFFYITRAHAIQTIENFGGIFFLNPSHDSNDFAFSDSHLLLHVKKWLTSQQVEESEVLKTAALD